MGELKPCPFCGNGNTIIRREGWRHSIRCFGCGAESVQTTSVAKAEIAWNSGLIEEPLTVTIGKVAVFPNVEANKDQALKIVEEAAEVFGAWQTWTDDDGCINDREAIASECADVIQAVANMLYAIGVDDATLAMEACRKRNEERGRYDR